ncbi:phosphoserine aminotransferase [Chromobacterium alkanivorans]|uniref:3-phosphoserine/phosphohydroxythreonine transaminase n=1 Tax=Chromobacterium alkanivorans TaxID=1071719 RepID=UPI00216A7BA8|nr:3-phosphoserine/phosphohydroxythreonine transaminase [Chromobacterium alkanivorans]MCS3805911.1 phosphoserine aminotransferase [Chromobacterium alkanivorans]MCS3820249.1 phosphoserine aminotransferase [Chromobacterium alkanivorans]MCS3875007.1 phosphoserine aminotransferase [Chromobacterium alkanivorans]
MAKVYNFSAGPAVLPHQVLAEAQSEMLDWHGSGMCVMEMSHRGKEFMEIIHDAEHDLRELMQIPANYKVLFLQGGASLQFSQVPLNLLGERDSVDIVNTGHWSKLAIKEARRYAKVNVAASSEDLNFAYVPDEAAWQRDPKAAYLHYTSNETIGGLQFPFVPQSLPDVPLVCDMSSDFLSREVDVSQFGLIYAGAQKNIGPSGLVVLIVREDLLGKARADLPTMLNYQVHADADSMYNTPPTFPIYISGLVFKWLKEQGGVKSIATRNEEKAGLLNHVIESSGGFYHTHIDAPFRSRMNVVFRLKEEALEETFLLEARKNGLIQLKGHRAVGGIRASIYNAMPIEGVKSLANFMQDFARMHG